MKKQEKQGLIELSNQMIDMLNKLNEAYQHLGQVRYSQSAFGLQCEIFSLPCCEDGDRLVWRKKKDAGARTDYYMLGADGGIYKVNYCPVHGNKIDSMFDYLARKHKVRAEDFNQASALARNQCCEAFANSKDLILTIQDALSKRKYIISYKIGCLDYTKCPYCGVELISEISKK